ncbi:MAG: hypothetical protein K2K83_03335 [Rikenella sp.]|nr:hypothetical protein [Rikenella sp.]
MRHKLLLYGLSAAAVGIVIWACRRDRFGGDAPGSVEPTLTVSEARDFFEYQYSETLPYRTKLSADRPTGLMPGDFTPLWDKAHRAVADRYLEGIDLPIDPHFIFTGTFPEVNRRGDTLFRTVDVVQKLIVNRWHDHSQWNGLYTYIATLVPTPEYYARHRDYGRKFINLGDKNGFSGLVIYHSLDGRFVNADKYSDGVRVAQVYDPVERPSLSEALERLAPDLQISGGTPAMYAQDKEIEIPPVIVTVCRTCKMQGCICKKTQPECKCLGDDDGGKGKEEPPVTPPGGGGGGGNNGDDDDNDNENNDNPILASLFDATNLTDDQKKEIEQILKQLSAIGISNSVLQQLMFQGKIKLTTGKIAGHEESFAIYVLETNTITLNMDKLKGSTTYTTNLRNSIIEESFHAFQYKIYKGLFNQRCYEFEAKVYGTIVINMVENRHGVLFVYLNPMAGTPFEKDEGDDFAQTLKRMTGDFTHNISVEDMNTLYQTYGVYCTQYPAGDPNWAFKALPNLIID